MILEMLGVDVCPSKEERFIFYSENEVFGTAFQDKNGNVVVRFGDASLPSRLTYLHIHLN